MYTTQFEAHVSPVRCSSKWLITENCSWRRQNSLSYQLFLTVIAAEAAYNRRCRSRCWIFKKICVHIFAALILWVDSQRDNWEFLKI